MEDFMIARFDKPMSPMRSFTAILAVYGRLVENQFITKGAAEGMLQQINEHPGRAMVLHQNVGYAVKRAWLEEDEPGIGRLMVEYEREK